MTTDTMVYGYPNEAQSEKHRQRGALLDVDQIQAYALQDAQYFTEDFCEEETNISALTHLLAQCRMENVGFAGDFMVYLTILRYFRYVGRELPMHYFDIATNEKAFAYYCEIVILYLLTL